jgi:hypothetical protein
MSLYFFFSVIPGRHFTTYQGRNCLTLNRELTTGNRMSAVLGLLATGKIQGVFKKRPNSCYKDFILHFKHCPLQSSPLYWRYTVPNVSSIVEMVPETLFL